MAEEIRAHLEMQAAANRAAGMSDDDAQFAARRQFGGIEQIKEVARDQRGWVWLEQLGQDLRYASRSLAKSPGYAVTVMLTLALGIATATSVFSIIYGVLLAPYPYARSNEIWAPEVRDAKSGQGVGLRMEDYLKLAHLPAVDAAMATGFGSSTLSHGLNPEIVTSPHVTAEAFRFLGVPPVIGRGLVPSDIRPDGKAEAVAVLSFRLWQRLYNGDPNVVGKKIVLDDVPHEIVGVMPPRFGWYTENGLWLPLSPLDLKLYVRPIVRFKPGVSKEVAAAQLLAMLRQQARQDPERFPKGEMTASFNNYLDVTVASGAMRTSLIVLLGAVGFLLLIACTNVANLQLVRGAGRRRELAVRLALGASRGRVARQLLTESVVLAVAGGALGVALAFGLIQLVVTLLPPQYVPNEARVTLNGWVLGFSTGLSMLTGLVAGFAPAWQCTRADVNEALKDGGPAVGSRRGIRTRHAMVIVQIALSVVLLVGAGMTTLAFVQMRGVNRGFRTERMLLLQVPLLAQHYPTFGQRNEFVRDFTDRLRALPGVEHVTLGLPPGVGGRSGATIQGQPKLPDGLSVSYADSEYLATYGLKLAAGRNLTPAEVADGAHVALVTEAVAKLWTGGVSPLGRTIQLEALVGGGANDLPAANPDKIVTVVGVVRDVYLFGPQRPATIAVVVPYTLRAPTSRVFVLRTAIEPAMLLDSVRTELRALDREQPMLTPLTFKEIIESQAQGPRFNMALFGVVAGIALALAAASIYSVVAYAVAQRSREIGVRMALGASTADVQRLFLTVGVRLVGIGLLFGTAASLGFAQLVRNKLYAAPEVTVGAFGGAITVLAAIALLACAIPARRATRVDPVVVLRAE